MSLNSIGYRGIISIALLTPIAVVLAFCDAKAMDDIDILAVYALDKTECNLTVGQALIDRTIINAGTRYSATPMDVIKEAARRGVIIRDHIRESGQTAAWCEARRVK